MESAAVSSRRARLSLVASLGVISTTGLNLGPKSSAPSSARGMSDRQATAPSGSATLSDDQLRGMILGRWTTKSNGTRIVENRADGTASMDLTFDFIAGLLFGEKMKLHLRWSVEKSELVYTIQSGEPKPAFDRMISTYGSQATYHFKSIGEKRMHLVRVKDPDESYIWTRVD